MVRYKSYALIANTFIVQTFVATGLYAYNAWNYDIFLYGSIPGFIYKEFMLLHNDYQNEFFDMFVAYYLDALKLIYQVHELQTPSDPRFS